jgi:hypothetical protein
MARKVTLAPEQTRHIRQFKSFITKRRNPRKTAVYANEKKVWDQSTSLYRLKLILPQIYALIIGCIGVADRRYADDMIDWAAHVLKVINRQEKEAQKIKFIDELIDTVLGDLEDFEDTYK